VRPRFAEAATGTASPAETGYAGVLLAETQLSAPAVAAASGAAGKTASDLTHGPVLPTLVRLAVPNMMAMVAIASVSIAETKYVGLLGRDALAAMAVVFPPTMLMHTLGGGAIGGAVSGAVSRALGAQDVPLARSLSYHSLAIALAAGLMFSALFLAGGPWIFGLLGATGPVLDEALRYSVVLFGGAVFLWLGNILVSIVRGTGNMRLASGSVLAMSALQIATGAALGLGLGPFPRWGMAGVAAGQIVAYVFISLWLAYCLTSAGAPVRLAWRGEPLSREKFWRILRIGLLACLSPVQSVLTVLVLTALVARLGVDALAGYGIGARLEFLAIPVAFGVGVATLTMVGMAMGSGNVARARQVAWTGGALSAAVVGSIGLMVCLWPGLWAGLFTSQAEVVDYASQYLRWAGPGFAFFGLGLTLFFAAQAAGRVLGPVLGGTSRLLVVCIGGALLAVWDAPSWTYFALVGVSMACYGLVTATLIWHTDWNRR
jgi:putative MATE family efflux protein